MKMDGKLMRLKGEAMGQLCSLSRTAQNQRTGPWDTIMRQGQKKQLNQKTSYNHLRCH